MQLTGGIICYIAGLATAPYLYRSDLYIFLPFVLAGLGLCARKNRFFPALLALFLFTFGLNQYELSLYPAINHQTAEILFNGEPVLLEANIDTINSKPEYGLAIDLDGLTIITADSIMPVDGVIRIFTGHNNSNLEPGDRIRIRTRIKEPRNFATPGAFDYARYLTRRHIIGTAFTNQSADFARIHSPRSWNPVISLKIWRNKIREQISTMLPQETAALITALTIGDRGAMTTSQRQLLAKSGLAHLFAISGLHLGLVASFIYLLLRSLYLRTKITSSAIPPRRILPLLTLPIMLGYLILTGSAISTMRALLMLAATVFLCCFSRRCHPRDILISAAFIILIFDPLALFEPSFQLSFAGAAGIILFLPYWQLRLSRLPTFIRYPLTLFVVTLSATLTTLPFVLLHFNMLAPAGPLLNLVAVPFISFLIIPMVLTAILLNPINLTASTAIFKAAALLLDKAMFLIEQILSFSPLQAKMVYLTPTTIFAASLLLLIALRYKQTPKPALATIIVTTSLLLFTINPQAPSNDEIRVTAFDVGQGDATLIQLPGGENYLVDGGGLYSKTFDTGERLIAPALGYLGVEKLDAVILTHDHPDHRNGLLYILQNFPVNAFWCGVDQDEIHPSLQTVIASKNIAVRTFPAGWSRLETDQAMFKIFVPAIQTSNLNDQSMALYVGQGNDGILMTGDLERLGIRQLMAAPDPGKVTLLKIPHHGSGRSDPTPLLLKYTPETAFVSVGFANRYGLPHQNILNAIDQSSVRLWRTDLDGSIRFSSNGHSWAITRWKKGLFR